MLDSMMAVEAQAVDAAASMLRDIMDMAIQQQAALLEAMLAANPAGLGEHVNAYA